MLKGPTLVLSDQIPAPLLLQADFVHALMGAVPPGHSWHLHQGFARICGPRLHDRHGFGRRIIGAGVPSLATLGVSHHNTRQSEALDLEPLTKERCQCRKCFDKFGLWQSMDVYGTS